MEIIKITRSGLHVLAFFSLERYEGPSPISNKIRGMKKNAVECLSPLIYTQLIAELINSSLYNSLPFELSTKEYEFCNRGRLCRIILTAKKKLQYTYCLSTELGPGQFTAGSEYERDVKSV
jgi:hypothetical protein